MLASCCLSKFLCYTSFPQIQPELISLNPHQINSVDKSDVEKSINNTEGEEVGLFFKWCFSKGLQITSNKNQLLTCSLMFRLMNHFNQNTRRKEEVPLQNNIKEKKVFRQKINGYVSVKMVDQVFLKSGKHVH